MSKKIERDTIFVGFWATKKFKQVMDEYVIRDTHSNLSDFIRSAIREKIQRDCPGLLQKLFEEDIKHN